MRSAALFGLLLLCRITAFSQERQDTTDRELVFSTSVVNALVSYPVKPIQVIYKQIDTVKLSLLLYRPLNFKPSQKYPTIIFFFGGGWTGGSMKQFQYHAKYFAARGMIAVLADYRVASRNNTTPFEAVQDARSAIRFLRAHGDQYGIDKNRIVASGGSAGGHLAAATDLTRLDDPRDDRRINARPDALVLFNPVIDNGPGGFGFERVKNRYREISPLHNIQRNAAPTLLFLGTKDKLIPVATAERYRDKMKEKGNRCELFLYKDQPHGFFNYRGEGSSPCFVETITQADKFLTSLGYLTGRPAESITQDERMHWWRDARFGMFIHWGLYAIPAGEWNGKPVKGIGEWIMRMAKIPVKEYRQLAARFNPVDFDAKEFVAVAKRAGMKYITITSKHHDGFAMFKSEASAYNIVDATPYGKDVIKALAAECREQGLKLCFYYSQSRDWNEPNGLDNNWDFPQARNFQQYLDEKVKPQLTELLTNYGQIGLIWFDTPLTISEEQARSLKDLVRSLQPGCIISGRLGGGVETDYISTGDNVIPSTVAQRDWEVPATLNDTWGFKKDDHNWKSPEALTRLLFDIAAKGGNYLLNVGPDAQGVIPAASVNILAKVGNWMKVNSEAIYGTKGNPFGLEFKWGNITRKPGKLYLGIFDWPVTDFYLEGLKNRIRKVYLLADTAQASLPFRVITDAKTGHCRLKIDLPPRAPDPVASVVVVEIEGEPEVVSGIWQQADQRILLPGVSATARKNGQPASLEFTARGGGADWQDPAIGLSWSFYVEKPGTYQVDIVSTETGPHGAPVWEGGQKVRVSCNGQENEITITAERKEYNPRSLYWKLIHTSGGEIRFNKPGTYQLSLSPQSFKERKTGFTFKEINLKAVNERGAAKPNILFILTDDLGKEWVSAYGAEDIKTPNIDHLAETGLSFSNFYSTPQCTPSRICLFTGQYPFRNGWINHWDVPRWGGGAHFDWNKNPDIARVMQSAGYKTAAAGKWQVNDFRVQPEAMVSHGFDDYCMWTGYEAGNPPSAERYWDPYIHTKEGSKTYTGQFGEDIFTDFLIGFMQKHRDDPMFLYYPMCLTHVPFTSTPDEPDVTGKYPSHKAMVRYMDRMVGKLVKALDELGLRENTIIIYTTDNGTAGAVTGRIKGREVQGGKLKTTENGICEPFIVNCPALVPSGKTTDALADLTDILPTCAALGGAALPAGFTLDGVSLADLMLGKTSDSPRNWIMAMGGNAGGSAAQLSDKGLENEYVFRDRVIRDKEYKLYVSSKRRPEKLVSIADDPDEKQDLLQSKDPKAQKAFKKLWSAALSFPERDNDPAYTALPPQPWDKEVSVKSGEWKK